MAHKDKLDIRTWRKAQVKTPNFSWEHEKFGVWMSISMEGLWFKRRTFHVAMHKLSSRISQAVSLKWAFFSF